MLVFFAIFLSAMESSIEDSSAVCGWNSLPYEIKVNILKRAGFGLVPTLKRTFLNQVIGDYYCSNCKDFVASSYDGIDRCLDCNQRVVKVRHSDIGLVQSIAVNSTGRLIAFGSENNIVIYDRKNHQKHLIESKPSKLWMLCFNQDSTKLAAVAGNQSVLLWDVATCTLDWDLPRSSQEKRVSCIEFRPSGELSILYSDEIKIMELNKNDVTDKYIKKKLKLDMKLPRSVYNTRTWGSWSSDGNYFLFLSNIKSNFFKKKIGTNAPMIQLFSVPDKKVVWAKEMADVIKKVCFSSDDKTCLCLGWYTTQFDTKTGNELSSNWISVDELTSINHHIVSTFVTRFKIHHNDLVINEQEALTLEDIREAHGCFGMESMHVSKNNACLVALLRSGYRTLKPLVYDIGSESIWNENERSIDPVKSLHLLHYLRKAKKNLKKCYAIPEAYKCFKGLSSNQQKMFKDTLYEEGK